MNQLSLKAIIIGSISLVVSAAQAKTIIPCPNVTFPYHDHQNEAFWYATGSSGDYTFSGNNLPVIEGVTPITSKRALLKASPTLMELS